MEGYTHIEDGHIGGAHGVPSLVSKIKAATVLVAAVGGFAHWGGSAVYEKILAYRSAELQKDLAVADSGSEARDTKAKISDCNTQFSDCEMAVHGPDKIRDFDSDNVGAVDQDDLSAITNAPGYTSCEKTRFECLSAIKN